MILGNELHVHSLNLGYCNMDHNWTSLLSLNHTRCVDCMLWISDCMWEQNLHAPILFLACQLWCIGLFRRLKNAYLDCIAKISSWCIQPSARCLSIISRLCVLFLFHKFLNETIHFNKAVDTCMVLTSHHAYLDCCSSYLLQQGSWYISDVN